MFRMVSSMVGYCGFFSVLVKVSVHHAKSNGNPNSFMDRSKRVRPDVLNLVFIGLVSARAG